MFSIIRSVLRNAQLRRLLASRRTPVGTVGRIHEACFSRRWGAGQMGGLGMGRNMSGGWGSGLPCSLLLGKGRTPRRQRAAGLRNACAHEAFECRYATSRWTGRRGTSLWRQAESHMEGERSCENRHSLAPRVRDRPSCTHMLNSGMDIRLALLSVAHGMPFASPCCQQSKTTGPVM